MAVEILKDGEATRANIIGRFRLHLGQARSGDVALFQFCGHGARWASSAAFRESFPDGRDEGLVCSDSRRPGGYDLADKELAVLIGEVAANQAETVVLLDCCHSGSATRSAERRRDLKPRLTQEVTTERPLETYLDGHYARLRDAGASLFVPAGRHILLAACERGQLAQEAPGHGLFTSALVDVLETSGGGISYADLFVRCRAAVRARAYDQDPQFEAYDRFDAGAGFLGRPMTHAGRGRYLARCDLGAWTVECGAITGLPSEPGGRRPSRSIRRRIRRRWRAPPAPCRSGARRARSRWSSRAASRRAIWPKSPACRRRRCRWRLPATARRGRPCRRP